jgi:sec-independent protein translocase protein TatB
MFGFNSSELAVVVVLALIFIGPKDLPKVMRIVGHAAAKARTLSRHFKTGVKSMLREAELEELRRQTEEAVVFEPPVPEPEGEQPR